MAFTIRGTKIKNPSGFKREVYNITNIDRVANGDAVGDFIAQKWKLYFTYDEITGAELDLILDLIATSTIFFDITYDYNGRQLPLRVYVGSIPQELHRGGSNSDNWVWKNVTFNLIQK